MNLERNIIDNILECELKLGHTSIPISFYYPLASLMELLSCNEEGDLQIAIQEFQNQETDRLGDIRIQELASEKGRYEVRIPAVGVDWVHDHFAPTDFMKHFVVEIKKRGNTLEDMVKLFYTYSDAVEVKKMTEDEWAVSFEDDGIDPYIYHIEQNVFGLEYHRFTKTAYQKTILEDN